MYNPESFDPGFKKYEKLSEELALKREAMIENRVRGIAERFQIKRGRCLSDDEVALVQLVLFESMAADAESSLLYREVFKDYEQAQQAAVLESLRDKSKEAEIST